MKYFVYISLFLIGLNCKGQDSAKHFSKSSISLTCGTNIVYPNVNQYQYINSNSNFTITPLTSVNPWLNLSYNRLLRNYTTSSFWLDFGVGFIENKYKAIANGYAYNDFGTYYINGIFNTDEEIDALEGSLGISVNNRITKKIDWDNGLQILLSYQVSSTFINFPSIDAGSISNEYYFYGYIFNLYYRTGITFKISQKFSFMPFLSIPILDISSLWEKNDLIHTLYNDIYPFNNFRTGIKITYNFIKK